MQEKRKVGRPRKNPVSAPPVEAIDAQWVAAIVLHILDGAKTEWRGVDDLSAYANNLQALREQIGGGFIARFINQRNQSACGAHHRFLPRNQLLDHYRCGRHAGFLRNAGETGELCIRARCRMPERANPLCDQIQRVP